MEEVEQYISPSSNLTINNSSTMAREVLDIFFLCLRMIQSTAAVFLNSLTLICMVKYRSLRNPAGILVASLALSDTLHGLVMYTLPLRTYSKVGCTISLVTEVFTLNVQLLSFCMLAMERRNSLCAQLNITTKWPLKKGCQVVVAAWALILTWNLIFMVFGTIHAPAIAEICVLRNYLPRIYTIINISFFFITVITVTVYYTSIARIVLKSRYQVASNQPITVQQRERRKADLQITKMMALVVGVFFTMYIPSIISVAFLPPSPPFWQHALHQVTLNILDVNFWINPAIYAWSNKQFRKAYSSLFSGCRRCCTTDNNPTVHINTVSPQVNVQAAEAPSQALVPRRDAVPLPPYLPLNIQAPLVGTSTSGHTASTVLAPTQDSHIGTQDLPRVD